MTNREVWKINYYTLNVDGIVTEDGLHNGHEEVRLYSGNDLIKRFGSMEDALNWLDKEAE